MLTNIDFKKQWRKSLDLYGDPTYLGFSLVFVPDQGPLFGSPDSNVDSALGFLQNRGEAFRAQSLIEFKDLLLRINQDTPWFWQSISGLDQAMEWDPTMIDPSNNERPKITIDTLESLDLRITSLMELYKRAIFDFKNRREFVPVNLQYFDLYVFVSEVRVFNVFKNENLDVIQGTADVTNENNSLLTFKLKKCKFDIGTSSDGFQSISNSNPEMFNNKISISFKYAEFLSEFPILDFVLDSKYIDEEAESGDESRFQKFRRKLGDEIKGTAAEDIADNIATRIRSRRRLTQDAVNVITGEQGVRDAINKYGSLTGAAAERLILNSADSALNDLEGQFRGAFFRNVYSDGFDTVRSALLNASVSGLGNVFNR